MRLLFDHNISPRLVERLRDVYPDSTHVAGWSLSRASDRDVWNFGREHDYAIATKDSDFNDLVALY